MKTKTQYCTDKINTFMIIVQEVNQLCPSSLPRYLLTSSFLPFTSSYAAALILPTVISVLPLGKALKSAETLPRVAPEF